MALDQYLKIDGITGDATAKAYAGQIEIETFSFGFSVPVTTGSSAGGTAGKPTVSDVSFSKALDSASTFIIADLLTGKRVATATLTLVNNSGGAGGSLPVAIYTWKNVLFTSYQQSGTDADLPHESIAFAFQAVTVTHYSTDASGQRTSTTVTYNATTNKSS